MMNNEYHRDSINKVFEKLNSLTEEELEIEFEKYNDDPFVEMLLDIGALDVEEQFHSQKTSDIGTTAYEHLKDIRGSASEVTCISPFFGSATAGSYNNYERILRVC